MRELASDNFHFLRRKLSAMCYLANVQHRERDDRLFVVWKSSGHWCIGSRRTRVETILNLSPFQIFTIHQIRHTTFYDVGCFDVAMHKSLIMSRRETTGRLHGDAKNLRGRQRAVAVDALLPRLTLSQENK
jgi:hypothetical protein